MTTLTPAMPPARWFPGAACFRGVLIALSCAVSLAYAAAGVAVRRVHALLIWIAGMNGLLVAGMLLADTLIGGTR